MFSGDVMGRFILLRILFAIAVLTLFPLSGVAQNQADIIRGQVVDEKGRPISGADVVALDSLGTKRVTKTNNSGSYTVVFQASRSPYYIHIRAVGQAELQIVVERVADEAVLFANATMHSVNSKIANVSRLVDVSVVSTRSKPSRLNGQDETAGELIDDENDNVIAPGNRGNLDYLAGTLPGIRITSNGLSVFGNRPAQNGTVLNGVAFNGTILPQGVAKLGVATSTYDPSRGSFSGGQLTIYVPPGSEYERRELSVSLDLPRLQMTNTAANVWGQRYANVDLNWSSMGVLVNNKMYYNGGLSVSRRWNRINSLVLNGDGAQQAGIAIDSSRYLRDAMESAGIPLTAGVFTANEVDANISTLWRVDLANPSGSHSVNLTVAGQRSTQSGLGASPFNFLSTSGSSIFANGSLQGGYSGYVRDAFLDDIRLGISYSSSSTAPSLAIPSGQVLVGTRLPDGSSGFSYVGFGGNSTMPTMNRMWGGELSNELSWLSVDGRHRFKLAVDLQSRNLKVQDKANGNGTYSYNSIADLDANLPSAFSRTIGAKSVLARTWSFALSLGDAWRPNDRLQIQYGFRLDQSQLLGQTLYSQALDSLLKGYTTRTPHSTSVSPRVGFTWMPDKPPNSYVYRVGRQRFNDEARPVRTVISGGTGLFSDVVSPQSILESQRIGARGNALVCLGAAAPPFDWHSSGDHSVIPTRCLDGTTSGVFSSQSPTVQFFSPSYRPSENWRSTFSFSRSWPVLSFFIEAVYSVGLYQPDVIDRNFSNLIQFKLSAEANRPVFVPLSAIDVASGSVSAVGSRRSDAFAGIREFTSDGRTVTRQVTITLERSPTLDYGRRLFAPSVSYTLSRQRSYFRGFDYVGSTAASPLVPEWARGDGDVRDRLQLTLNTSVSALRLGLYGIFQSGVPFTPLVSADINGDGYPNDRAFIPSPLLTPDSALRAEFKQLLSSLGPSIRHCLVMQTGQIAGRNSCSGPWTSSLNMSLSLAPRSFGISSRVQIGAYISNVLSGADLMLHGVRRSKGWGTQGYPDPTLLIPVGFDPGTSNYRYAINPHFGTHNLTQAPFTITIELGIALGPSNSTQVARNISKFLVERLIPEHHDGFRSAIKSSEPDPVKLTLSQQAGGNICSGILLQSDRLHLTSEQHNSLVALQSRTTIVYDSLIEPTVIYLHSLSNPRPDTAMVERIKQLHIELMRYFLRSVRPAVLALLKHEQVQQLPSSLRYLLSSDFSNWDGDD